MVDYVTAYYFKEWGHVTRFYWSVTSRTPFRADMHGCFLECAQEEICFDNRRNYRSGVSQ